MGILSEVEQGSPAALYSPVLLFLSGVFGWGAREVLRWRRLVRAGRHKNYLKAKYLILSAAEVVLAGAVALIFAPILNPQPFKVYGYGFGLGAGSETLIVILARIVLELIAIHMGNRPGNGSPDSFINYMQF